MKGIICKAALIVIFFLPQVLNAQMITGVWKGKINRQKVELKIIQKGDSLTGTSYYYESASAFRRYSIKGYFDAESNEAVWWDDQLIEERSGKFNTLTPGKIPLLSRADFNCPGSGKMMLDGKAGKVYDEDPKEDLHLNKTDQGIFNDEWNFVIDNYLTGANDPDIIDSVAALRPVALQPSTGIIGYPEKPKATAINDKNSSQPEHPPGTIKMPASVQQPVKQQTNEEKFNSRKKVFITEIPVTGDSIELRFYDNAEIDGDSIALFLNDKMIFEHIRLLGSPYTIKLAVSELKETNELTMVAENLGSIPPNTSYMVVLVGDKRYGTQLESTEGSSAMVRFVKKSKSQ
ncbi:MAG: hypothetical protein Q8941_12205 [Bacteroidota bacterium]|nr:hypothetical protein [Bacteroidota bacterium]